MLTWLIRWWRRHFVRWEDRMAAAWARDLAADRAGLGQYQDFEDVADGLATPKQDAEGGEAA